MARSVLESTQTIEELNAIVGDPNCERELRCKAVLSLFVNYVPPLVSINEIPKILTNHSWLGHSNIYQWIHIHGWTHHNFRLGSMFTIFLFPSDGFIEGPFFEWKSNQGVSDYLLTLVFDRHFPVDYTSREPEYDASKKLWNVLSGSNLADTRLMEFSVAHPNGGTELFTQKGLSVY
ncbi:MAG: hypothetical protein KDA84_12320 [Planctomycetaceae bacterium]|nr:hypothetical protein [Planctomycetaceae bacterium]